MPKAFFDYAEAGSYQQHNLRANCHDLKDIKLRQRVMVDISGRSTETTIVERMLRYRFLARVAMTGFESATAKSWRAAPRRPPASPIP